MANSVLPRTKRCFSVFRRSMAIPIVSFLFHPSHIATSVPSFRRRDSVAIPLKSKLVQRDLFHAPSASDQCHESELIHQVAKFDSGQRQETPSNNLTSYEGPSKRI